MNFLFTIYTAIIIFVVAAVLFLLIKWRYGTTAGKTLLFWGLIGFLLMICIVYSINTYNVEVKDGGFSSIPAAMEYYSEVAEEDIFLSFCGNDTVYLAYYGDEGNYSSCVLSNKDGKYIKIQENTVRETKQHFCVSIVSPYNSTDKYVIASYFQFDENEKFLLEITDSENTNFQKINYKYDDVLKFIGQLAQESTDYWIELDGVRFEFDLTKLNSVLMQRVNQSNAFVMCSIA